MRRFAAAVAVGFVMLAFGVVQTPVASAAVPPATGNNAVVTVRVGGDRTGIAGVTGLAGVTLGLFTAATATAPVAGFGTCTSDVDGDCSFTVPNTQSGGTNRDRRFYVKQISAAPGYFANPTLAVGPGGSISTAGYVFQTGSQLRAGATYRSSSDFMIGTGNTTNTASGGIWQDSRDDPALSPACGLRVAIVADLSTSVGTEGLADLKTAATTFVDALTGTPSSVALFTFATNAPASGGNNANQPGLTPVSTTTGAASINAVINGWSLPGGQAGGTNWDRGLAAVAAAQGSTKTYDLVIVLTDGNPTYSGSPVQGPGNRTRFREVENGIFSANAIKAAGSRVVAFGVGSGIAGVPDNLRAISGPVEDSDFYQTDDYAEAGTAMRALALGNCQGSITVVKQVLPADFTSLTDAQPAGGWTFGATTTTTGVTISPTSGQTATDSGALNFGLTFPGGTSTAPVTVTETQQTGYTLHQVDGANAVCTRVDTGASLPVVDAGTGFTVDASDGYPVSCTMYNIAPAPPAEMVVNKQWIVNGTAYPDGDQPASLAAALQLDGTAQGWGVVRTGFSQGDEVQISETTRIAPESLCTITSSRLTRVGTTVVDEPLPYTATLNQPRNDYVITNTVDCPSQLTLVKQVDGGSAAPTEWTLTATAPTGALPGPSGTSGSAAASGLVTPGASYALAESGGDPRYIQLVDPDAELAPGSTGSWFCQQVSRLRDEVFYGFSDGLNGSVAVPPGLSVRCTAVNQTAGLTLIKHVVNSHGGSATAADWTLTATPAGNSIPTGLEPISVPGSETGTEAQVRPDQVYALGETGPSGYTASEWSCSPSVTRVGATVIVPPAAEATCTITNTDDPGLLTLRKIVDNGTTGATGTPADWTLTATPQHIPGQDAVSGNGQDGVTSVPVFAGSYDLSEAGPGGYTASSWSCTGGELTGTAVAVPNGADVICTITNTAIETTPPTTTPPTTTPPTTTPPTTTPAPPTTSTPPTPPVTPTPPAPPAGPGLPNTGVPAMQWSLLGLGLLILGGAFVLVSRRRRRTS